MLQLNIPEFWQAFDIIVATNQEYQLLTSINAVTRVASRPFYATGMHGFYGYIFADLIQHQYVIEREKGNRDTILGAESATRSVLTSTTKTENGKVIEMVTKSELYSPFQLANTSSLPLDLVTSPRKLRQVSPLLTCFRALWDFTSAAQRLPTHSHADLQLFTTLATEKHKELQLPTETLRSEILRSFLQNLGSEITPVSAFLGGQVAQDIINVLGQREQPLQNLCIFDGEESKGPVYALHPIYSPGFDPTAVPVPSMDLPSGLMPPVGTNGITNFQENQASFAGTQAGMNILSNSYADPHAILNSQTDPDTTLNSQLDPDDLQNPQMNPNTLQIPQVDGDSVSNLPIDPSTLPKPQTDTTSLSYPQMDTATVPNPESTNGTAESHP